MMKLTVKEVYKVGQGWIAVNKEFTVEEVRAMFEEYKMMSITCNENGHNFNGSYFGLDLFNTTFPILNPEKGIGKELNRLFTMHKEAQFENYKMHLMRLWSGYSTDCEILKGENGDTYILLSNSIFNVRLCLNKYGKVSRKKRNVKYERVAYYMGASAINL